MASFYDCQHFCNTYVGMIHDDKKALCFILAEQLREDPKSGTYIKMW